ncbi:MAG TPA: peptidoglycan-binding domain-containing protein [Pyrinomonadaceae bacterium]|nr:peptidoglycan-binding domain-containing protein [Pyrinomonadaceae bacterium]
MRKLCALTFVSMLFALAVAAQPASTNGTAATPKTDDTAKNTSVFRPTKDQIKQGQTILKEKKLYDGEATGSYNDPTRAAIKSFQKAGGLEENGRFDKATLQKMNIPLTEAQSGAATASKASTSSSTASTGTKRPAPFRANEEQIKAAQKILIDGKLYTGTQSGDLDQATRDGLKKYQEANKLKVTGTLNAVTLEKMGIVLTDAQKANVAAAAAYEASKSN